MSVENPTSEKPRNPYEFGGSEYERTLWCAAAWQAIDPHSTLHSLHFRWAEFVDRLAGKEGCDAQHEPLRMRCAGDANDETRHQYALAILVRLGLTAEEIVLARRLFDAYGGHCDCEILLNVEPKIDDLASALCAQALASRAARGKKRKGPRPTKEEGVDLFAQL